jgi:hypothetical protein
VGFPRIAAFDLTSDMLPPPANLAGNNHHCVLALVHHADDPYTSTQTNTDANSLAERKAAHKNLTVVQFTGTLPSPPPVAIPVRLHNPRTEELLADLLILLNDYPGPARLFLPPLETDGPLDALLVNLKEDTDFGDYERWMEEHIRSIERAERPYHEEWVKQRLEEVKLPLELGRMFWAAKPTHIGVRRILLMPERHHTVWLMLDRPPDGKVGQAFDLQFLQIDSKREEVTGGLDVRVELVPEPKVEKAHSLKLWRHGALAGYAVVRAQLSDPQGTLLTPVEGASVRLALEVEAKAQDLGPMRWHKAWRCFYRYLPPKLVAGRARATGLVKDQPVAEARLEL